MAATSSRGGSKAKAKQASRATTNKSTQTERTTRAAQDGGVGGNLRVTAERTVDVPVGVALTVVDRVNEIVEPLSSRGTANERLQSLQQRVTRELNRYERRGSSARRKAGQRVRRTRNRVERDLKRRRTSLETTVNENRAKVEERLEALRENGIKVEDGLRRVQERVTALV